MSAAPKQSTTTTANGTKVLRKATKSFREFYTNGARQSYVSYDSMSFSKKHWTVYTVAADNTVTRSASFHTVEEAQAHALALVEG